MTTNNKVNNAISNFGYQNQEFILTSAQVLGMFASPVPLIPAPGANKAIWINCSISGVIYNSIQYTSGGNGQLIYTTSLATASLATASSAFTTGSNNAVYVLNGSTVRLLSDMTNQGISMTNVTGAFLNGNSPIRVRIWWTVIDTI